MRSKASFRRERCEAKDDMRELAHDAEKTISMQAIQVLVEKARHAPEEVQKSIIRAGLVRHLYPFEPRQKQVDAIWHLVFQKKDLLLAAKTSFGKSVIFQSAPLFCRGGVGIIIIPLDRIGEEQFTKIQRLPGARPIFINGRTDKTDHRHWRKRLRWECTRKASARRLTGLAGRPPSPPEPWVVA